MTDVKMPEPTRQRLEAAMAFYPKIEEHIQKTGPRTYSIPGRSGEVHEVTLDEDERCDCKDFLMRESVCVHRFLAAFWESSRGQ